MLTNSQINISCQSPQEHQSIMYVSVQKDDYKSLIFVLQLIANNDKKQQLERIIYPQALQKGQHCLKQVHQKSIISISPYDQQLFFTSSQDKTIRMWDLRLHSSVKLFRNAGLDNLSNCENDRKNLLFVGGGQHVYSFDVRKEGIFVQEIVSRTQQPHFDDIQLIKFNVQDGVLGACDHQGDIRLYNSGLECTQLLDQGHNNIVNSFEFVNTEQGKLCISGGFDCKLVHWKIQDEQIVRQIDLQELFTKLEVKNSSMPFIYQIYLHKNNLFATTESGHVICFPLKQLKKHRYLLEASLSRVIQVRIPDFNQNILITLSKDGSFSLFDHTKRLNGVPVFLQKYKCTQQPNWIQVINREIIVSSSTNAQLHFFSVK